MNGRPIRLMFVIPDLTVGGAERHVTTLLPRLDPDRFTPSAVCIGEEGGLFPELLAAGIDARALHLGGKRQSLSALYHLVATVRELRPDIVVVRGYNAETLGRIAARAAGVEHTVMWVHNLTDLTPRSAVRTAVDRVLNRWTSAYFGVAEAQRTYLVDRLGYPADKIRIIRNGVDPELFHTAADPDARAEFGWDECHPVIGIVAELSAIKDHATFLRAARLVVDQVPRARLLVIGDGACRADLEALADALGITPNVRFTGVRRDVTRLLRTLDVFTLSSLSECFSIALLEAMACGKPVVCTTVGGNAEIVDDGVTGYLVPPKDPQQLAIRLLELLSDPITARRMGSAGRERVVTEFGLDRSVAAAQRAFEDVITGQYAASGRG
ncbi:glycosyltransferase [Mycolicibacterium cosmeticum]|uniref:glycosyltransferase n=1 Tax=Mycolicibacterium cosmeticum TaxID=258533 RepID=UPI003204992A